MKRLRLGAVLHFLIAIGHIGCLFALDEAFEAYGIREIMHQMVSGHVWMLNVLILSGSPRKGGKGTTILPYSQTIRHFSHHLSHHPIPFIT